MPVSFRAERQTSGGSPPHPASPSSRSIPPPHKSIARSRASPQQSHPPPAQSPVTLASPPPPPCDPRGSSTARSPELSCDRDSSKKPAAAPSFSYLLSENASDNYNHAPREPAACSPIHQPHCGVIVTPILAPRAQAEACATDTLSSSIFLGTLVHFHPNHLTWNRLC